jgi:LysM repeat protein
MASGTVPLPNAILMIFPTPTITPTFTPSATPTPTRTATQTPLPTPTTPPPIEYVIKEGDSCLLIALIYEVSVDSIIMLNSLGPECTVAIGHTILVPHPTPTIGPRITLAPGTPGGPTPAPFATYVVQAGDTCLGIALNFGITMDDIMIANGLPDCNFLIEGRVLFIPPPGPPPSSTPAPPGGARLSPHPASTSQTLINSAHSRSGNPLRPPIRRESSIHASQSLPREGTPFPFREGGWGGSS